MIKQYEKYLISTFGKGTLYTIKPNGKGSIPKALTGGYTSIGEAIRAIEDNKRK